MEQSRTRKAPRQGYITIHRDICKGCYLCISVCPQQVIGISDALNDKGYYPAEYLGSEKKQGARSCTGCATCALICPDVAIEVYRD